LTLTRLEEERGAINRDIQNARGGSSMLGRNQGKVFEAGYDPNSGDLVVVRSGPEPASSRLPPPLPPDPRAGTEPRRCGMVRAVGVLLDRYPPGQTPVEPIMTTHGGGTYSIAGTPQVRSACLNCRRVVIQNPPLVRHVGGHEMYPGGIESAPNEVAPFPPEWRF
jgi:hypothetical protein